jgi:aspartyl-tRNA synthetase
MRYSEAMERFGSDKPDLRFGMELQDAGEWAAKSDFMVFGKALEAGGRVMGITVQGGADLSRKQIDKLGEFAGDYGAKGLAWWKAGEGGGSGPLARFCADGKAKALMEVMGASDGDLCLFAADREKIVHRVLGALRARLGRERGLIQSGWVFVWVTHFPMFEYDEEAGSWVSLHHPFTAPDDWDMGGVTTADDPRCGGLLSRAYDLVLNGWELGSGSIRIHKSDVQERIFDLLGIDPEEQREKFGFLLDALAYGAPPHGGFAMGLDRLVALTAGLDNIRDVIAFPKTTSATDLMCQAPSRVRPQQLDEIHIQLAGRALRQEEDAPASESS